MCILCIPTLRRLSDPLTCHSHNRGVEKVVIIQAILLGKLPYPTAKADFFSVGLWMDSSQGPPDLQLSTLPTDPVLLLNFRDYIFNTSQKRLKNNNLVNKKNTPKKQLYLKGNNLM